MITNAVVAAAVLKGLAYLATQQQTDGHFSEANTPALTALPLWAMTAHGKNGTDGAKRAAAYVLAQQKPDGGFYTVRPPRKGKPGDGKAPAGNKLGSGAGGPGGLSTYNTAVCLSALFESKLAPTKAILDARTFLAESQILDEHAVGMTGGFGYGKNFGFGGRPPRADLSNTGYALDAMRRTESVEELRPAGGKRADLDWKKAEQYVSSMQVKDGAGAGGFVYNQQTPHGGKRVDRKGRVRLMAYGAMTYDGILSMCYAKMDRSDPRVRSALQFASKYWSVDENPNRGRAGLYYYYDVLSRALHAAGVDKLQREDGSTIDWKRELSEKLASLQRPDGSWANSDNTHWENNAVLTTSFALMALALCQ